MSDPLPRCPRHPEQNASDVCSRCGAFVCALDRAELDGKVYCGDCAVHPAVDYLEAFRREHWGRRDSWAWLLGVGGVLQALLGVLSLVKFDSPGGLLPLAGGVVGICFWFRLGWARQALVGLGVLTFLLAGLSGGLGGAASGLIPMLVSIAIYRDPRDQLFFQLDVPRDQLLKAWKVHADNRVAHTGFSLSLVGLLLWPIAPLAFALSVVGLRRVDPQAHPPVGRRRDAILGIVLGVLGSLFGLVALAYWRWGQ